MDEVRSALTITIPDRGTHVGTYIIPMPSDKFSPLPSRPDHPPPVVSVISQVVCEGHAGTEWRGGEKEEHT